MSGDGAIRLLICDDAAPMRTLLRIALGAEPGIEVVGEAADGVEALAEAARCSPDVILLDLAMPRMDGLEAMPELQRVAPHARVVVFSGFQERLMAAQSEALGAVAYVEKGTDPSTLAATIRDVAAA